MDGLLNFLMAFVFMLFAVLVLFGKADRLMARYKLVLKDGKLKSVKYREYDAERTRPLFALILFVLAVFVVLEYLLRPLPEWCAFLLLAVLLPVVLYMELRCRRK
jgi:hypothetical protein